MNVQIDDCWASGNIARFRNYAAEIVSLDPEVILANSEPSVTALQRETKRIPIVFTQVSDPVGAGFVPEMARPAGNVTGFTLFDEGMSGWLDILKQMAPKRARPPLYGPLAQILSKSRPRPLDRGERSRDLAWCRYRQKTTPAAANEQEDGPNARLVQQSDEARIA
jgi:hypothetical protein